MPLIKLIFLCLIICFVSLTTNAQDTTQHIINNRVNSIEQQKKPYVILISIDGFRWDLADKYKATNILNLRNSGVEAEYMKPSYPSLTFPNHYTLVTGLYPAHHGIVDNTFYDKTRNTMYRKSDKLMALDSSWYGGKPLWILAEEQKMLSAVFYWPGSEISMNGIRPTYFYDYNEIIPLERRINVIKDWLDLPEEKRPHFIAVYFPQVDKEAHLYTVDSEQTEKAVHLLDEAIGKIAAHAKATGLDVNFILVSDHGMTTVDNINILKLPKAIDLNKFIVPPGSSLLHIYAKEKSAIRPTYRALKREARDYDVYLSKKIPKAWHYNRKSDIFNRVGDMILVPKLPFVFSIYGIKPEIGQHGYDPKIPDMRAAFYAWGPRFKSGLKIPAFENVNIYPLITNILGLTYGYKIDGRKRILSPILK